MINLIFADAATSVDKKAITFFIILVTILFILFASIGTLIRKAMKYQAKRVDKYMNHVYKANVVDSPASFRKYSLKKNLRILYKQSLIPFLFFIIALAIWLIAGWVRQSFNEKIFENCKDLFFIWDFGNEEYYTKVFGIRLLASWPGLLNEPHIEVEHITSYFEGLFIVIGAIYYLVSCQSFLSRLIYTNIEAGDLFTTSLKDIKAQKEKADLKAAPLSDIPPQD